MNTVGILAALSGAIAVIAGARGAHGATGDAAEWLRTGSHYQMVHAVAALVVMGMPGGRWPAMLFVAGAALFAGSLYALAFGVPARAIWFVTPLGGLVLIVGWLWLAAGMLRG
ncbi:MAG TPA: DUF423 domain-containing protein [Sphingomonas sp.]|jgi:uncharacterized membrane protein YgdD (TMEM256/DUF423 family)|uniref:DUF423 domain-containing protein n=1 Tax=Sphingomonas sp. TaxID=28214 RepID=UPI002ED7D9AF